VKLSMEDRESFAYWFLITCASSDPDTHSNPESKFNQMVKAPEWSSKNIEFSVHINGFEFSNLEDVFKRVNDHIDSQVDKRLAQQNLDSLKIARIQDIMNARNLQDLEYV